MVVDTWTERELPILQEVVEGEGKGDLNVGALAERLSLERHQVILGVRALYEARYVEAYPVEVAEELLPTDYMDIRPLERGRRAVGQWPSEDPFDDFVAVVERMIEREPDEGRRSRLERLREALLSLGQGVGGGLLLEFLKGRLGL